MLIEVIYLIKRADDLGSQFCCFWACLVQSCARNPQKIQKKTFAQKTLLRVS